MEQQDTKRQEISELSSISSGDMTDHVTEERSHSSSSALDLSVFASQTPIHEGMVFKIGGKGRMSRIQKRFFILYEGVIIYYHHRTTYKKDKKRGFVSFDFAKIINSLLHACLHACMRYMHACLHACGKRRGACGFVHVRIRTSCKVSNPLFSAFLYVTESWKGDSSWWYVSEQARVTSLQDEILCCFARSSRIKQTQVSHAVFHLFIYILYMGNY